MPSVSILLFNLVRNVPLSSFHKMLHSHQQVLQEKYHAMREDEATKDAPEIEVFGTLST
jgi:hypothetical protein